MIWYSCAIGPSRSSVTRYLMPLLAPGATIHSKRRSKSLKVSMVMMSPLSAVGEPPVAACFNRPASIDQPVAGKPVFLKPRHPWWSCRRTAASTRHRARPRSAVACSAELTGVMAVRS